MIKSIEFADSSQHLGVQWADILASSINYAFTKSALGKMDDFANNIMESKAFNCERNGKGPTTDVTPEDLDMTEEEGVSAVDFLAENLEKIKPSK